MLYMPADILRRTPLSAACVATFGVGGSNLLRRDDVNVTGSEPDLFLARCSGNASPLGASEGNKWNVVPFCGTHLQTTHDVRYNTVLHNHNTCKALLMKLTGPSKTANDARIRIMQF